MQFIAVSTIRIIRYIAHARQLVQKVIGRIVNKYGNKEVSSAPQLIYGNNNDVIINNNQCCQMSLKKKIKIMILK